MIMLADNMYAHFSWCVLDMIRAATTQSTDTSFDALEMVMENILKPV